jgi:heparin binding hemagglutinin HbhA
VTLMRTLPTNRDITRDIRHARRQAEASVSATMDRVRTPLLAALGAVETAGSTVTEAIGKARSGATGRTQGTQDRLQSALDDLQRRVSDLPAEIGELRSRLDPAELRKLVDAYADVAQKAYTSLAERGEEVFGEFRDRPQVQRALGSVESGVDAAQHRLEALAKDLNELADDLLARFARGSRSAGEAAAQATQQQADQLAEQVKEVSEEAASSVSEAGGEAASSTRSTARKAGNRASAQRKPAARRTTGDSSGSTGDNSKS